MLSDKGLESCKTIGPVDIDNNKLRLAARCNSNVGARPFAPPFLDLARIGRSGLEAAFHARVLASVLAAVTAAAALAVLD